MSISNRIKKLPEILGLNSLRQVAIEIDFSSQQLSRIALGKSKPGFEVLEAILNKFPISSRWLMKGEGDPLLSNNQRHVPTIDTDLYDLRKLVFEVNELKEKFKNMNKDNKD